MRILVDSREPAHIAAAIAAHPLLGNPEIATLEAGDVWLGDLIIERKEPSDLLGSIADGRLFAQVAGMRRLSEWSYLVITGPLIWDMAGRILGTAWTMRSVQGALLQAQELGTVVVFAKDDSDFAPTLAWLAQRDRSKIVTLAPRKFGIPMTPAQEVLASLPGIGPERAEQLLLKFDTAAQCLEWLAGGGEPVPGIGPKTEVKIKESARRVLGLNPDESLRRVKNE